MLFQGAQRRALQVWQVDAAAQGLPAPEYVCSLSGHSHTVNVVRFSPTGAHCTADLHCWPSYSGRRAPAHSGSMDAESARQLWWFRAQGSGAETWEMSAGTQLASGGDSGELFLWERDYEDQGRPWRRQTLCRCVTCAGRHVRRAGSPWSKAAAPSALGWAQSAQHKGTACAAVACQAVLNRALPLTSACTYRTGIASHLAGFPLWGGGDPWGRGERGCAAIQLLQCCSGATQRT